MPSRRKPRPAPEPGSQLARIAAALERIAAALEASGTPWLIEDDGVGSEVPVTWSQPVASVGSWGPTQTYTHATVDDPSPFVVPDAPNTTLQPNTGAPRPALDLHKFVGIVEPGAGTGEVTR